MQIWIDRFADSEAAAPGLSRPGNQLRVDAARVQLPCLTHDHPLDASTAKAAAARLFDALRGGQGPGGDEHLMLAKALYDYHGLEDDELRCDRIAALIGTGAGSVPASTTWRLRRTLLLEYCLDYWGHSAAAAELDLLLSLCTDVEVPLRDRGVYFEMRAYALAGLQRWDEAEAQVLELAQHQTGGQLEMVQAIAAALRAARALATGDPQASACALQAVRLAAAQKWQRMLVNFPHWAAQIAQAGLDAGVEVEFLTAMVGSRQLQPPDPHRADWPWHLRVWALGPLRVERDGLPMAAAGKAPRKPLDLLALLAAQGGRPLAASVVMDELRPSLEAEAPRASLDMALSRLCKLLELPDAVRWVDGQLLLDAPWVWTDAAAFEARCEAAEAVGTQAGTALTEGLAL